MQDLAKGMQKLNIKKISTKVQQNLGKVVTLHTEEAEWPTLLSCQACSIHCRHLKLQHEECWSPASMARFLLVT